MQIIIWFILCILQKIERMLKQFFKSDRIYKSFEYTLNQFCGNIY